MYVLPWWDIPLLIGLGLLAGGLAGLLGIGGGLIFAPLLLWLDLPPHQALATSSFAIVPTALAGLVSHLRSGSLPVRTGVAIGLSAFGSALLFGGLAGVVSGWLLLAMQTLIYVVLAFAVRVREEVATPGEDEETNGQVGLLAGVGCIAGWTAGMLGLGGGLVMVPLMNGPLGFPSIGRCASAPWRCSAPRQRLRCSSCMRGEVCPGWDWCWGGWRPWQRNGPPVVWIVLMRWCWCGCCGAWRSCWRWTAAGGPCIC